MSKNVFQKAMGVIFESDDAEAPPTRSDAAAPAAPPMSDEEFARLLHADKPAARPAPVAALAQPQAPAPVVNIIGADGRVDFGLLYQGGAVPGVAFGAERTMELMASLPKELPEEIRRTTVLVSIKSMGGAVGASPEMVAGDAAAKIAAIQQFERSNTAATEEYLGAASAAIVQYKQKIADCEAKMKNAQERRAAVNQQLETEVKKMQEVVGFFPRASPWPMYESNTPKL